MRPKSQRRLLFPSPSVLSGAEREPQVNDFESLSKKALGEGAFGEVYKVRHKISKELYAIKVVSKQKVVSANLLPQLRREIRIMYSLSHPHIVKLYNHFEDDNNFYLVLELAEGGTLWQRLARFKSFDEASAAQYIRELILALEYLHSRDPPIIHRDIKPENLLLDKEGRDGRIKVADFGWSNFFNAERTRMTYCGTLDYLAPEMINQQGHTTSLDLWNLGVLLFELLTGSAPFQAPTQAAMFEKILKVRVAFPKNFPPLAKDLISRLLRAIPDERLSLIEVMNHPWMQTHQPIRPTMTQTVQREALPCQLEAGDETSDIASEDPIKPFQETEYRVLSKINNPREEEKKLEVVPSPQNKSPSPVKQAKQQAPSNLENELKQTRDENKKFQEQIDDKEAELSRVNTRIQELENIVAKLDAEYEDKRKMEKSLKDQLAEKSNRNAELAELQEDESKLYTEYEGLRAKCLEKETELNLLKTEIENMEKLSKEKTQQASDLERDVDRVKSDIDQTKMKYNKSKSEIQEQFAKISGEIDELQRSLGNKDRDSSVVSVEALLAFTQENLDILKNRARVENELLKQYQDANERLIQLDNKYSEMRLAYENYLNELKKHSVNREAEFGNIKPANINSQGELESIKDRLRECIGKQYSNKLLNEELVHLQSLVNQYEKSLGLAKKQSQDLDYLRQVNQKKSSSQQYYKK